MHRKGLVRRPVSNKIIQQKGLRQKCVSHKIIPTEISLAGATTSIMFVATKDVFCRDKSMFAATFCRD